MKKPLLIRRLKATAIDEVTLQQCPIELQNDAVSDTTKDDSSNWLATQSALLFKELI